MSAQPDARRLKRATGAFLSMASGGVARKGFDVLQRLPGPNAWH